MGGWGLYWFIIIRLVYKSDNCFVSTNETCSCSWRHFKMFNVWSSAREGWVTNWRLEFSVRLVVASINQHANIESLSWVTNFRLLWKKPKRICCKLFWVFYRWSYSRFSLYFWDHARVNPTSCLLFYWPTLWYGQHWVCLSFFSYGFAPIRNFSLYRMI